MRRTVGIFLGGLVLAATILSVTATVDDSQDGGLTSVSVTRKADPPTYTIKLCQKPPCPTSGTYTVTIGKNTLTIRKSGGAWEWQVELPDGATTRAGWTPIPGGWAEEDGNCCVTISDLTSADLGNPEDSHPGPGGTTANSVSFSASGGTDDAGNPDSTSTGSLRWTQSA